MSQETTVEERFKEWWITNGPEVSSVQISDWWLAELQAHTDRVVEALLKEREILITRDEDGYHWDNVDN